MSGGSRSKPVGESGLGRPALGYAETATVAFSESSERNGYMRSGPREQLSPTESGATCLTAFQ